MKPVAVIRHVPHEGPGLLGEVLAEAGLACRTIDMFDSPPAALPPGELAGLVVMGGPMNVDQIDRYRWLAAERGWIVEALRAGLPLIGICLGCQLLARALGASVRPALRKEIGWLPIELTPEAAGDPLLAAADSRETVLHWHGDTYDLPEGAIRLAGSEVCPQQAFRWGEQAWGLQFHLETTGPILEEWLTQPGMAAELAATPGTSAEQIRRDNPRYLPRLEGLAREVFRPFAALCQAAARD